MHMNRSFRSLSVVLVLALLVAPWAAEARPAAALRADSVASPSIIDHFMGWLVALWGDVGCTMDPSGGGCHERIDVGCTMDPDGGGCRDRVDNGCTMDPNGGCRESQDGGCGWDPNGGCRDNG